MKCIRIRIEENCYETESDISRLNKREISFCCSKSPSFKLAIYGPGIAREICSNSSGQHRQDSVNRSLYSSRSYMPVYREFERGRVCNETAGAYLRP